MSTGLSAADVTGDDAGPFASLEAFREELYEAGPGALHEAIRLGLRLDDDAAEELRRRILAVLEEFAARPDPPGRPHGVYFALHLMAPERPGG